MLNFDSNKNRDKVFDSKVKRKMLDKVEDIENKFEIHYDQLESKIKNETIGLVTFDEMAMHQNEALNSLNNVLPVVNNIKKAVKSTCKKSLLSFDLDEDDDVDCAPPKRQRKNPTVDTSFLPDIEREEVEMKLRASLVEEWKEMQENTKNESLEIEFSFWDGTGHAEQIQVKKGTSVHEFLQSALEELREEFIELKSTTCDQLMFVRDDVIVPFYYTFYDLIVAKAYGRSGLLFGQSNDLVSEDMSKVCTRDWYDKNRHIYPADRWEAYDPLRHRNPNE